MKKFLAILLIIGTGIGTGYLYSKEENQKVIVPVSSVVDKNIFYRNIIKERIIDLPEDSGKFWLTMFLPKNPLSNEEATMLMGWFNTNPDLNYLVSSGNMRTNFINKDSKYYEYTYGHRNDLQPDRFPIIIVQEPSGKICYKASRGNFPVNGNILFREIAMAIEKCFPEPKPEPKPKPDVNVDVKVVNPLPDTRQSQENTEGVPTWLLAILGALGIGSGGILALKKDG